MLKHKKEKLHRIYLAGKIENQKENFPTNFAKLFLDGNVMYRSGCFQYMRIKG